MIKLLYILAISLLSYLSCFSQNGTKYEEVTNHNELRNKLIYKAESIKNISCDFELIEKDKLSGDIEISSGKYYSILPKQIKWEYKKPSKYSIVFNNKARAVIIENDEINPYSISSNRNFKLLNQIIAQYFNKELFDSKNYSYKYYENSNRYLLKIIVKDSKSSNTIQNIDITFNKIDFGLVGLKININNIEIITLELSQRFINNNIPKEIFKN